MNVVVLGSEGSGTTYIANTLIGHPDSASNKYENFDFQFPLKHDITHISIPTDNGFWVQPEKLIGYKIIIVRRNIIDSVYSTYRRFYYPDMSNYALKHTVKALKILKQIIDLQPIENVFHVTYEDIDLDLINELYEYCGLCRLNNLLIPFENRNGKWMKNDIFIQNLDQPTNMIFDILNISFGRKKRITLLYEVLNVFRHIRIFRVIGKMIPVRIKRILYYTRESKK